MTEPDRAIWSAILDHLRENHPAVCRHWFDELEPVGVDGGAYGVRARSNLHRDYLRRAGVDPFNDAVGSKTGQLIAVRFLGPDDPWSPKPEAAGDPQDVASEPPKTTTRNGSVRAFSERDPTAGELAINPDFGFEQFVVGPNNDLAYAAAKHVSEEPGREYNPLFIHGGVGLGKTHLLQAVCIALHETNPHLGILYISCDGFRTRFHDAVRTGALDDFRRQLRGVDMLVVDDIHFLAKQDRTKEEFFHTFNALHQAGRQVVLSSDAAPGDIPDLEERLVSRFKSGLVAEITPPGFETRVEIVKRKATLRGIDFEPNVPAVIAEAVDANIRELEGAIVTLQLKASVAQRKIDADLARELLGPAKPRAVTGPTIDQIIETVSDFYHVKPTDVLGKRRHKSVSLPRQIGMYIARRHTRHSLEEIGVRFGGRDHTTVMHAVRQIETKLPADAELSACITELESKLVG